jgi:hypothetical protein
VTLTYEGLVTVSFGGRSSGLYWLRLLQGVDATPVVLLTDVDGNPGCSVVNGVEEVCAQVAEQFLDGASAVWVTSREGLGSDTRKEVFSRVTFSQEYENPVWEELTTGQMDELAGRVAPVPDDLRALVLAAGGRLDEPEPLTFKVIPVATLPLPRNLFRCMHADRFMSLLEAHEHDPQAAASEFFAVTSHGEMAECKYHDANWKVVCDLAVEIIEFLGSTPSDDDLEAAVDGADLPGPEAWALHSLLGADGLSVSQTGYGNGQHRGCAVRFSGATRVVVVE